LVPIDINTASLERIRLLRSIGWIHAARIIAARPFRTPYELVTRGIMSHDRFDRIAAEFMTGESKGVADSASGRRGS
jgi:DNA uptake protein ComE-like DNA-binding protein